VTPSAASSTVAAAGACGAPPHGATSGAALGAAETVGAAETHAAVSRPVTRTPRHSFPPTTTTTVSASRDPGERNGDRPGTSGRDKARTVTVMADDAAVREAAQPKGSARLVALRFCCPKARAEGPPSAQSALEVWDMAIGDGGGGVVRFRSVYDIVHEAPLGDVRTEVLASSANVAVPVTPQPFDPLSRIKCYRPPESTKR
jgi:hypothetical protein